MATLYINFWSDADKGVGSGPLGSTTLTTSTTNAAMASNMPQSTAIIEFISDTAHYVTVAGTPVAAAGTGVYVPANQSKYMRVNASAGLKAAGITLA